MTLARANARLQSMQPMRARVQNGRIVIDEPTELPEGTELYLVPVDDEGDDLDEEERAALHATLRQGIEDWRAGRTVDASGLIAELRSRS